MHIRPDTVLRHGVTPPRSADFLGYVQKNVLKRHTGENFLTPSPPPAVIGFRCSTAFLLRPVACVRVSPSCRVTLTSSECNFFFPLVRSGVSKKEPQLSSSKPLHGIGRKQYRPNSSGFSLFRIEVTKSFPQSGTDKLKDFIKGLY